MYVGEHKEQTMKKQTIVVQVQLQMTCSYISPATKTHSSYEVKLQKEVKSTQKQPNCNKKVRPMRKKRQHEKCCEIQGGGPGVSVMVG